MAMVVRRFDVFLVQLDPSVGSEIQKTRPCVIISPDEMNRLLKTVLIAPLTSVRRNFPFRVDCQFQGKAGQIVLDQIRAVDKARLVQFLDQICEEQRAILDTLADIFAE
ncbi:type II toxin-antitoxin system PemK/MazF family toxin [Leptolyngbya boryana CZ1]|uniref:Type II toxin-antitoxin system PemK/MazF family toxin n=1 Tax=Leptolyngbya boryana CZ1 TaxID=3060204 RepID=A0AA96WSW4_LEPBY|nr:type II toxin-antitoxin system PemK/MazF family toxin [Leptolyngbya boryana]WNZ43634.1 type II toxin-antitoxin system PemK/MazF family toxin [Leptolyngbya boryana CZ1]